MKKSNIPAWCLHLSKVLETVFDQHGKQTLLNVHFVYNKQAFEAEVPVQTLSKKFHQQASFKNLSDVFGFPPTCEHIQYIVLNNKVIFYHFENTPPVEMVIEAFRSEGTSLKASKLLGISEQKCRKILVSCGEIPNPYGKQIEALLKQGKTYSEIGKILGISKSCAATYAPYSRKIYNSNQTENALKVAQTRLNKKRSKNKA